MNFVVESKSLFLMTLSSLADSNVPSLKKKSQHSKKTQTDFIFLFVHFVIILIYKFFFKIFFNVLVL